MPLLIEKIVILGHDLDDCSRDLPAKATNPRRPVDKKEFIFGAWPLGGAAVMLRFVPVACSARTGRARGGGD